jgi:hypothetical protein
MVVLQDVPAGTIDEIDMDGGLLATKDGPWFP